MPHTDENGKVRLKVKPFGEDIVDPTLKRPENPDESPEPLKDDDLLIVDEQGNYCRVTREQYEAHPVKGDTPEFRAMLRQMELMANQGVVLADLPRGALNDVDCACYLINLAGIRGPSSPNTPSPAPLVPSKS